MAADERLGAISAFARASRRQAAKKKLAQLEVRRGGVCMCPRVAAGRPPGWRESIQEASKQLKILRVAWRRVDRPACPEYRDIYHRRMRAMT